MELILHAGLSTSRYNACPTCGPSLVAERAPLLHKVIYTNHHRFLPEDHQRYVHPINGIEPYKWTMSDWGRHWDSYDCSTGPPKGMSRRSILLTLPYWEKLKIQHLLDPMHIFKNVAQTIWDHLIGKKDSIGAREDLRSIRRLPTSAVPRAGPSGRMVLPKAPWILAKKEQDRVKGVIASIRTPTGYMRSLKGAFTKTKKGGATQLYGLKSHDWHKMLQVYINLLHK